MGGGEGFSSQVCYPVTEIVVTCRDEAALFIVKGLTDRKLGLAAITVCGQVREIKSITQKEGVEPFLGPQLRPIDCGRLHCQPGPVLFSSLQSTCL